MDRAPTMRDLLANTDMSTEITVRVFEPTSGVAKLVKIERNRLGKELLERALEKFLLKGKSGHTLFLPIQEKHPQGKALDLETIVSSYGLVNGESIIELRNSQLAARSQSTTAFKAFVTDVDTSYLLSQKNSTIQKLRNFFRSRPTQDDLVRRRILPGASGSGISGSGTGASLISDAPLVLRYVFVGKLIQQIENSSIREEGIYRTAAPEPEMRSCLRILMNDNEANLIEKVSSPHVLPSVLKTYFAEVSPPLIPYESYTSFLQSQDNITYLHQSVRALKVAIENLPVENQHILELLIKHLLKVSQNSQTNKMTGQIISNIFAPLLLRRVTEDLSKVGTENDLKSRVLMVFLECCPEIFPQQDQNQDNQNLMMQLQKLGISINGGQTNANRNSVGIPKASDRNSVGIPKTPSTTKLQDSNASSTRAMSPPPTRTLSPPPSRTLSPPPTRTPSTMMSLSAAPPPTKSPQMTSTTPTAIGLRKSASSEKLVPTPTVTAVPKPEFDEKKTANVYFRALFEIIQQNPDIHQKVFAVKEVANLIRVKNEDFDQFLRTVSVGQRKITDFIFSLSKLLVLVQSPLPSRNSNINLVEKLQAQFYSEIAKKQERKSEGDDFALALKLHEEELRKSATLRPNSANKNESLDPIYYFGEIERKNAEAVLFGLGFDGFLIRYSSNVSAYTLSKYDCKSIKFTHIIIKEASHGFRLEKSFDPNIYASIPDLVNYSPELKNFMPAGKKQKQ